MYRAIRRSGVQMVQVDASSVSCGDSFEMAIATTVEGGCSSTPTSSVLTVEGISESGASCGRVSRVPSSAAVTGTDDVATVDSDATRATTSGC